MRRLMAGIAAAMVLALMSLGPASAAQHEVSIQGNAFVPSNLTVAEHDVVRWTNKDLVDHNVYSDETPALRSPGSLSTNETYTFTFGPGSAGAYSYYCTIHGKNVMSGVVTVRPPATTTTARPAPATTRAPATTARPATTSRATTVTTATSTTETLALETTTTEQSTTTTGGEIAIATEDGGGGNGAAIAGLVLAVMAVLGGGAYAIYRLRSGGV